MTILIGCLILLAYLIGSLSGAILWSRAFQVTDPRQLGSQNPGATNMLRLYGKQAAVCVLIFDALKGAGPVCLGSALDVPHFWLGMIAVAACIGHMAPIYFQFQGGKGVATALGALTPIGLGLFTCVCCTWLLVWRLSRYSSVASVVTACITPWYTYVLAAKFTAPVSMLCLLILIRHSSNMRRLWQGFEDQISSRLK